MSDKAIEFQFNSYVHMSGEWGVHQIGMNPIYMQLYVTPLTDRKAVVHFLWRMVRSG